ncbi:MAG TPA: hypothetical protein ENI20_06125 [Bacteroides sp.]|nr:hypothetical protein [Bacteroides sp.]
MKQFVAILFILMVLVSCGSKNDGKGKTENGESPKTLAVTNYPLYYFTQKIAGDEFDILFPVPQDETAFTTWLDQSIALDQAKLIYETLRESYPDYSQVFDNNYKELEEDILELDSKMDEVFNPYHGKTLYASHPVYQYLGTRTKS